MRSSAPAFVQLKTGLLVNEGDCAAEFYYSLDDGTKNGIQLALDVDGKSPDYNVKLHANFDGIKTQNNPSSVDVGFLDDDKEWTPFIMAGDKGSYVGNNPPTDWMKQNLPFLGCRTLQQLSLPGSHNAGMSKIQFNTAFASPSNTQTQQLDILGQLNAGIRYFDIRPVISHGDYYTGHYSYIKDVDSNQGAVGQKMDSIIDNINKFTDKNSELVILYLSHTSNTDADYHAFNDDEWNSVLHDLTDGLKHRWTVKTDKVLTKLPLSDFIKNGPAVVIVVEDRDKAFLDKQGFTGKGFFPASAFPKYDNYANTNELDVMRDDQYKKFTQQLSKPDNPDQVFLLSWTMTLLDVDNLNLLDKITTRADYVNNRLAALTGDKGRVSPFLWDKQLPNIVLIDNVRDNRHLTALSVAFNRFTSTC
ncbi:hypothetical protein LTR84_002262 [Exophiala bonariae]|uniref:Phosphatidylinositol-specific phospholipase C X domain-containing protein n=1 Tax=Exophiala bonariae TaxID=1690606 RepID=A0AAV9NAM6_9EURO|nr:hypothetical protein LTR84_002262 [Exophiala bonariae]